MRIRRDTESVAHTKQIVVRTHTQTDTMLDTGQQIKISSHTKVTLSRRKTRPYEYTNVNRETAHVHAPDTQGWVDEWINGIAYQGLGGHMELANGRLYSHFARDTICIARHLRSEYGAYC